MMRLLEVVLRDEMEQMRIGQRMRRWEWCCWIESRSLLLRPRPDGKGRSGL